MNKSLKKILITEASFLILVGVGAGTNNLVTPAHAHSSLYNFWHTPTGKLYHGITLGGHYYPAGTKLYNTNYATGSYGAAMGPSPYAPRYLIPSWARKNDTNSSSKDIADNTQGTALSNNINTNASSTTVSNENNTNNFNTNGSTQYTSKNSLPQTGESDGAPKAIAAGAVALGASASLMALSMAKKHRQEADLDTVAPIESTVNNDDSDNSNNKDNNVYNTIMSVTFKDISNDLKQM